MSLQINNYTAPDNLLDNRIILVTGAGDGIGYATAMRYARHGATVILVDKEESALETLYDKIEQAGYPTPVLIPLDPIQCTAEVAQNMAHHLDEEFSQLDGLVHCASQLDTLTPIEHYDTQSWTRVIQVNLNTPFFITHACLPLLKRAPQATILFTSSQVARQGQAYWGAFATAGFGIEGFMQVLAKELEDNSTIRVNSLDPGPIQTAQRRRAYPGEDPSRLPKPEDITGHYLYLMGPAGRKLHGQALTVEI
ncbi:MAG: YciK family oxidoreductase [Gammaproteobacteria bacterium]|nr:YciK family oxidoreductase [Gammaproteobacteria bacterium]